MVIEERDGESMEDSETYHKITQEAEDVYSTDYGWAYLRKKMAQVVVQKVLGIAGLTPGTSATSSFQASTRTAIYQSGTNIKNPFKSYTFSRE